MVASSARLPYEVRSILLLILHRYFELIVFKTSSAGFDDHIQKSIRYITKNYSQPITIHDLAQFTGLNHMYLGKLFKQSTGMTFRQYLMTVRLNNAENMLRSGEYNVNETAPRCGFSDVFYSANLSRRDMEFVRQRLSLHEKQGKYNIFTLL